MINGGAVRSLSMVSGSIFIVYFALVLFGKIKLAGPFPIWVSIPGALVMCYLPVKLVGIGDHQIAIWLAVLALIASIGHLLIAIDATGYGPLWVQHFLDYRF